jgi:fumarate reductase flavoprotein subunit
VSARGQSAEVVVVGGGLAGLSAAYRLARRGTRVLLIEKHAELGGSSAMSGGWFALSDTALQRRNAVVDSDEAFLHDMIESGGGYADEALLQRLLMVQAGALDVIERAGAWTAELKISAGMTVPRAHLIDIRRLLAYLEEASVAAGARIQRSHPAQELIWDGERVRGIRSPRGDVEAERGVVLTSGGFSRSRALVELFVPHQAAAMPYGGVANTGDGLRMAWTLGAGVADVGHVAATYGQHAETGDDEHELLTANYLGAILVNMGGRRFTDESASYKNLGSAVLAQPQHVAHQVFDAVVRARSKPGVPLSDMDRIEELGHLTRADTLDELAASLRVDAGELAASVRDYNAVVAGERADEFGRTGLVNGIGELVPLAKPPFYAYSAIPAMTSTYGGITVSPRGQARRMDGSTIAGLFAAGEVVGGYHGSSYMTGMALTKALACGLDAADALAGA